MLFCVVLVIVGWCCGMVLLKLVLWFSWVIWVLVSEW